MTVVEVESVPLQDGGSQPLVDQAAQEIAERGFAIIPHFLPRELVGELRTQSLDCWNAGAFRSAGVGRGASLRVRPEIRNDAVLWLDQGEDSPAFRGYRKAIEALRIAVNRSLYLGLVEFEGHLSVYPPGAYYRRHLDQFRDVGLRTLTCVLYLNESWAPEDGGQLRLYLDKDALSPYVDVEPEGGTLAAFLSADFFHEVLPARKTRLALTGWLKRRG